MSAHTAYPLVVRGLVTTFICLLLAPRGGAMASPIYDLLLSDGKLIDPVSGRIDVRDVAIVGTEIAVVQRHIPHHEARRVINLRGKYVSPGFIDLHAHVGFPHDSRPAHWPHDVLQSGVTTLVDAGSWGADEFELFRKQVVERAPVRVLAFLNIVASGMRDPELEQDPRQMDVERAVSVAREHADIVVGIKTAHYWARKPFDAEHPPWLAVDRAQAAASALDVPVMVDFWPRTGRTYQELLQRMRPGDIHTHMFAQQFRILDERGHVARHLREARQRGVLFDLGHGEGSFLFRNAVPAIDQDFFPDSFGTDLHQGSANAGVIDMAHVLGKMLSLGVPLHHVVAGVTARPAAAIHRPDLGVLRPGAPADIAVFHVRRETVGYTDCGLARFDGDRSMEIDLTVRGGQIVFDPSGLSMVRWDHAPPAYFRVPELQGDPPSRAQ